MVTASSLSLLFLLSYFISVACTEIEAKGILYCNRKPVSKGRVWLMEADLGLEHFLDQDDLLASQSLSRKSFHLAASHSEFLSLLRPYLLVSLDACPEAMAKAGHSNETNCKFDVRPFIDICPGPWGHICDKDFGVVDLMGHVEEEQRTEWQKEIGRVVVCSPRPPSSASASGDL